jgi:Domain of unknown function (DUF3883)
MLHYDPTIMSKSIESRVLFARIGWMNFYRGIVPGDPELIGGGAYNETEIGSEVLNFAAYEGRVYGFVQGIRQHPLTIERIDEAADGHDRVTMTLVIFVSRRPHQSGQVIIGWYRNAVVHREADSDPRPKFRSQRAFNITAKLKDAVLLPTKERWEAVPSGTGAFGQSNVCYPLDRDGHPKKAAWMSRAIEYVLKYAGANLVVDREVEVQDQAAAQAEAVDAAGQGQGFASTPGERRAIEDHAMARALRHFKKRYPVVENVSKQKGVLDLRCGSHGKTIIHVEVKGTTTPGESVILTRREVERARKKSSALYILHSIRLKHEKAIGGVERVIYKWDIGKGRLTPLNFSYKLP